MSYLPGGSWRDEMACLSSFLLRAVVIDNNITESGSARNDMSVVT